MIPRISLAGDYAISRIIKGGWHLAGDHGAIEPNQARKDMAAFVDAGITTFDCADIYTGVEHLIGSFRRAYPAHAKQVQIHTKFVPDLSDLHSVDRAQVEAIIDRSLTRLGMERLDLVQFHWWDFAVPRYVEDGARTRPAAPRREDRAHRRDEFRHAAAERTRRCRNTDHIASGAILTGG